MRQNEALAFLNLGWTYVNKFLPLSTCNVVHLTQNVRWIPGVG